MPLPRSRKNNGGEDVGISIPTSEEWVRVEVNEINVEIGQFRVGLWMDTTDFAGVELDDVEFVRQGDGRQRRQTFIRSSLHV